MPRLVLLLVCALSITAPAQNLVAVSSGFTSAAGLVVEPTTGDIYVADTGDGTAGTGAIYRLPVASPGTPAGFVTGLVSELVAGIAVGVQGLSFRANGTLLCTIGGTSIAGQSGHVIEYDSTGTQVAAHDIATFALTQFTASNIFSAVEGPNGDLFVTDSANGSVFKVDNATGVVSLFATLPGVANTTGVGNDPAESVPTKIIYDGTNFYVSCFSGFPHSNGWSQVFQLDAAGVATLWVYSMNCLNDIAIDPVDGALTMLSFATYSQTNGFNANTGTITKVVAGVVKTLSRTLYYPSAMAFDSAGTLNVSFPLAGTISALYSTQVMPGSNEDFAMIGWTYPYYPINTPQPVTAGSSVYVGTYSPNCGFCGTEGLLVAEAFVQGSPPFGIPSFPSIQVSASGAVIIPTGNSGPLGAAVVSEFFTTLAFTVPAGLAGNSVRFQALALSNAAANGLFATTDAVQFDIF